MVELPTCEFERGTEELRALEPGSEDGANMPEELNEIELEPAD